MANEYNDLANAGLKWSMESEEFLIEKLATGFDYKYIAECLRRSESAVQQRAAALGLKPSSKSNTKWSALEVRMLKDLTDAGATEVEIAEQLGRSRASVNNKKARLRKERAVGWKSRI